MKARRRHKPQSGHDAVAPDILLSHPNRDRVDISGKNGDVADLPKADREYAAAGTEIERVANRAGPGDRIDHLQAAGGRPMMPGSKGLASIDLDRYIIRTNLVAIMRAVNQKAPCPNRLQPLERFRDPVDLGDYLPLDQGLGEGWRETVRHALPDLFLLDRHQVDRGFPEIPLLVDLGGPERVVLLAEDIRENVEDALGILFGGADVEADLAQDCAFGWLRMRDGCHKGTAPSTAMRSISR